MARSRGDGYINTRTGEILPPERFDFTPTHSRSAANGDEWDGSEAQEDFDTMQETGDGDDSQIRRGKVPVSRKTRRNGSAVVVTILPNLGNFPKARSPHPWKTQLPLF